MRGRPRGTLVSDGPERFLLHSFFSRIADSPFSSLVSFLLVWSVPGVCLLSTRQMAFYFILGSLLHSFSSGALYSLEKPASVDRQEGVHDMTRRLGR